MSLVAELTSQLNAVAVLLEQLAASRGARRRMLWAQLTQRAAAYAWIDSHVVYPALRRSGWKGVRSDLLTASSDFQRTLADLLVINPDAPTFPRALAPFRLAVAKLAAVLQPGLAQALHGAGLDRDPLALLEAGRAFAAPPQPPFDLTKASQLVQEASVVLGSLPADRHAAEGAGS